MSTIDATTKPADIQIQNNLKPIDAEFSLQQIPRSMTRTAPFDEVRELLERGRPALRPKRSRPQSQSTQTQSAGPRDCVMVDALYADAPLSAREIAELQRAVEAGEGRPKIMLRDLPSD